MARIILKPGEAFQHLHQTDSCSKIARGLVELDCNGKKQVLEEGQRIQVPAGVVHTFSNLGAGHAHIDCRHEPIVPPPPPPSPTPGPGPG